MRFRSPLSTRHSAFTLPELFIVIVIVAILVGLLFPGSHVPSEQANKVKATTDLMNTMAAVKQYYTEYGEYPFANQFPNTDITFGDSASGATGTLVPNNNLYDILRNYPNSAPDVRPSPDGNFKQIVFFEGRNGIATSGNPKGGFASTTTGGTGTLGCFYDPWGHQYAIVIDGNQDGWVPVPYLDFPRAADSKNLPPTCVKAGCAGWSIGKDGKIGRGGDAYFKKDEKKPSDDVITWQ